MNVIGKHLYTIYIIIYNIRKLKCTTPRIADVMLLVYY